MPTKILNAFGWCQSCHKRIGARQFRELPNGTECIKCIKYFDLSPTPQDKPDNRPIKVSVKTLRKAKVKKEVRDQAERDAEYLKLRTEENLLKTWWLSNECGHNWRSKAAAELGIDKKRLMFIARRLQRKKLASFKTLAELLIDKLTADPQSAYEIAPMLPSFKFETIYQELEELAKQKKIRKIKNFPDRNQYSLLVESDPVS